MICRQCGERGVKAETMMEHWRTCVPRPALIAASAALMFEAADVLCGYYEDSELGRAVRDGAVRLLREWPTTTGEEGRVSLPRRGRARG